MIIDAHAHLSATTYGSTERYLELLASSGIAQGVVCAGGMLDVRQMNDFVFGKSAPSRQPRNDYVASAVKANPRLSSVAFLDPLDPAAPEELSRCFDAGFRGLFLSPLIHPFSFTQERVLELCRLCGERGFPVISHNGWRAGANTPDFAALARKVPHANFLLEHMGAPPADVEARQAATELPNFFLETSLGSYLHIVETLKSAGAGKVVFGSEYPLSHPGAELAKVLLLPITEREKEQILCGNARALFHLA